MSAFEAFHLPGGAVPGLRTLEAGQLTCRYPVPDPSIIRDTARRLRQAGEHLARRSVADIVAAIDSAAGRLADPADPLREQAERLLPLATGYSSPMVRLILDRMTADWRADALERLLQAELGDTMALDGFAAREQGVRTIATGPGLMFQVFSGNVPGVAVTSLIRGLLVKAPSLGKLAAGEPVLPVLFARALQEADAEVGSALGLTYWPGGTGDVENAAIEEADAVVVYGGDEAVESLRPRTRAGQRLVIHGPKISLGAVGAGPLEGELGGVAERAARAVATFDQQGCVSPHSIWVEGDGQRAEEFAGGLATALERLSADLPRGELTAAEASAIHQERGTAEMRAHADSGVRLWAGAGTSWTVLLEPADHLRASCLNRFVRVHPLPTLEELSAIVARARGRVQSVALEGTGHRDPDLARDLARAGVDRITTFDRLPWPSPWSHHDGAPPLRELLRWVDRET